MAKKAAIVWNGLTDLDQALQTLPQTLHGEAVTYLWRFARAAAAEIQAAYPVVTGNLKRGVRLEQTTARLRTAVDVVNRAPHAYIYEHGTVARHYTGRDKLGRQYVLGARGAARAGNVFLPRAAKWRARYKAAIVQLLRSHGAKVAA